MQSCSEGVPSWWNALPQAKDVSKEELQRVSQAISEGRPITAELPLSTASGSHIWSQMSITPVMSETDPGVVENYVRPFLLKE